MNITIFNKDYVMRRFADGAFTDTTVSIHLHEDEHGSGQWPETQGIVRTLNGHGDVELREADLNAGTKGDRVLYRGRWYECVSSVLYDRTVLSHYNYKFVVVPEDAVDTITVFNAVYDEDSGMDTYTATVIRGVSWVSSIGASLDTAGLKEGSKYTIRIPEDADFSGKVYVEPGVFNGAVDTFTFMPGDTVVRGEETEITNMQALREKYRDVVRVMNVSDFRRSPNARHWKIEGE